MELDGVTFVLSWTNIAIWLKSTVTWRSGCSIHYHSLDPDHTTSISFGLQPERGRNRHGKEVTTNDLMQLPEGLKITIMTSQHQNVCDMHPFSFRLHFVLYGSQDCNVIMDTVPLFEITRITSHFLSGHVCYAPGPFRGMLRCYLFKRL
jgi:hypothetical protein